MEECELGLLAQAQKTAETVVQKLKDRKVKAAFAESCTAGLVSSLMAEVPGASAALWGSFVCYTKEAKVSMLGIDPCLIEAHGLVSAQTAAAMAAGAFKKSGASFAAAVTGIAGPDGDGSGVPVGTVWAAAAPQKAEAGMAREFHFTGSRNEVRLRAAIAVLELIGETCEAC